MRKLVGALVIASFAVAGIALADDDDGAVHAHVAARQTTARPHVAARVMLLGRSVQRRPIRALIAGDPNAPVTALVVGCIHGNEPAGIRVVERIRRWTHPGIALWLVPDLNPDGRAANTRQNGHGVDLNRNFPFGWRPLGPRGIQQYAGTGPLSEPESRIAHTLILRLKPRVTIWFHQPLGVTDRSGGDIRLERRFARLSGLPLRQLTRYPGSVTTWEDFHLHVGTAFVVELPPGPPPPGAVIRYANAVEQLLSDVAKRA